MDSVEGRNYRIEPSHERLTARIYRRPELDTSAGADEVERMAEAIRASTGVRVHGLLLDLTEAPTVIGPRTQATLQALLAEWVGAGRRAVLVVGPSAVQRMQIERLVGGLGSANALVSTSLDVAVVWLGDG